MNNKDRHKRRFRPGMDYLHIWEVPRALKARFKAVCANKGTNMRAAVLGFIQQFIKE